ncbi:hypothetical protein [Enterovirga sp. CN4-39]|uniref:hypothetical protein n=1 Tax=Enterovirga sp. CN4-39 TaxID=3400910 RepID=UPI003C0ABB75
MIVTADDAIAKTRPFAEALVDRERRKRGSKMSAYAAVADLAGVSESWVRKLLGGRPVVVELRHFLSLAEAYRRVCDRVEAERDLERTRFQALRAEADAALAIAEGMVVSPAGQDRRGEET